MVYQEHEFLFVKFRYRDKTADTDFSKLYNTDFYFNNFPKEYRFKISE